MNTAAAAPFDLTRAELVAMLNALRERYLADKGYLETPIGRMAGRYLNALEFDGYSRKTVRNREQTLGWLAFDHPDLDPGEVSTGDLRAFLEGHWRDAASNTKAMHVSSLRCFFDWAHDQGLIATDPARKLKMPRHTDTERRSHPQSVIRQLVVAQPDHRDQVAILLLYWCALRRNELRQVQFRHIDLGRRVLTVFGKGGRILEQNVPEPLALELERHIFEREAQPDEFLLYPFKMGRVGAWPDYRDVVVWEDRFRPLGESAIDKWWQRCRRRANLDDGQSRVLMHELRHSAGTHMQEAAHDLLATQHFLRHKSAATTERVYMHVDRRQHVARATRQMPDVMTEE